MAKYVSLVKLRLGSFVAWRLKHIPMDSNEKADALDIVVASLLIKETMFLPVYYQPQSLTIANRVHEMEGTSFWMTPIVHYLSSRDLPDSRTEAHKIMVQTARFSLVNRQLYKWSLDSLYLKCLTTQQGHYTLVELHEGICGNHPGGRTLTHKAHTRGY